MWKADCSKIYYFVFMMSISYHDMHYVLFCIKRKSYNLTALTEIEEKNDDNSNTLLEIAIIY